MKEIYINVDSSRKTVDYASYSLTVTLAKRCKSENITETIHNN